MYFEVWSGQQVHEQPAAQFWLEPGRFGRHDLVLIGQFDQFGYGSRMERERYGVFPGINQFDQFIVAANSADKVDPLVGARVLDAEQRRQERILQNGNIQPADGVLLVHYLRTGMDMIPVAVQIHAEVVALLRNYRYWGGDDFKAAPYMGDELGNAVAV